MTACGAGRRKDQCGLHDSGGTSSSTAETRRRRRCRAEEHARQLEAGLTESPAAGNLLGGRVRGHFHRHGNDGELGLRPFHKASPPRSASTRHRCVKKPSASKPGASGDIIGAVPAQMQQIPSFAGVTVVKNEARKGVVPLFPFLRVPPEKGKRGTTPFRHYATASRAASVQPFLRR